MFILSEGMFEDAKKVALKMLASGQERGEIPFSPLKPITITTNPTLVGDMVSFKLEGTTFYFGFEKTARENDETEGQAPDKPV
jgi:hypothetical protein